VPSARDAAYYQTVARLGIQAAEALDCAHQQGVVHRDVKPANLMVDGQGRLWVMDFGLAHVQSDVRLTMSGDVVGTLRYMSPEQALGQRMVVDHRTDMYSLGATLYELLTLEPVFGADDRRELLRQIAFDEPVPPRRRNNAIPAELETIVLKALEKEAAARYATAQELADDLRRFLDQRPIQARRPTLAVRVGKWARRHRALVRTAVAALAIVAVVATVCAVLVWRAWQVESRARAAEVEQRREAEARRLQAREAADYMYTAVADQWLANRPRLTGLQRGFLLKALAFYKDLADEQGDDADVRGRAAEAYSRVAAIEQALGHHKEAAEAFREALARFEQLRTEFPEDARYQRDLALAVFQYAEWLAQVGRLPEAEQSHRRALAIRERLADEPPADPLRRIDAATSSSRLGWTLAKMGRRDEAERALRRSIAWVEALMAKYRDYDRWLPQHVNDLANLYGSTGRFREAEELYRRILPVLEKRIPEAEGDPQIRVHLALSHGTWANILRERGRRKEAEEAYGKAVAGLRRAVEEFPEVPENRRHLGSAYTNLGLLLGQSDPRKAEAAFRSGVEQYERLARDYPSVPDYASGAGAALHNFAGIPLAEGKLDEARGLFEKAVRYQRVAYAANRRNPTYRQFLINHHAALAGIFVAQRDHVAAARAARALLAVRPDRPFDYQRAADAWANCAVLAERDDKLHPPQRQALAKEYRAEGERCVPEVVRLVGENPAALRGAAWQLANRPGPPLQDLAPALALAAKLLKKRPAEPTSWKILGVAEYRAGHWQAALTALEKSVPPGKAATCDGAFFLAMANWRVGKKDKARRWYDAAVGWMDKNAPRDEELRRLRAEAGGLLQTGEGGASGGKAAGPRSGVP
jgi:tetratricopeptide (TPR) repeat protein